MNLPCFLSSYRQQGRGAVNRQSLYIAIVYSQSYRIVYIIYIERRPAETRPAQRLSHALTDSTRQRWGRGVIDSILI
nr:MAG TPA: hypothetical protein [Bacteriophage sp.]